MDIITLIKLIVGLCICAVPFGIWLHMIMQIKRDGRELEKIMREDFPSLLASSTAPD